MVNYTSSTLRRPHSINTSFPPHHLSCRNNNPDPPQQFQHFPSNPYEQEILKKELLLKEPIKEKDYYNNYSIDNNNNAIPDNSNSVSLNSSDNMDIVPNSLSLHNNFTRQDSLDLSALPLDPTLLYPSNSIFTEPHNGSSVISGPSAPYRQTSLESPFKYGYQNSTYPNYNYSIVDQVTPLLPSFNRQSSFELMAKQEQQLNNNNTQYMSYGEIPTENLLPAPTEAPIDIQYEQSAAAQSYSTDSTNEEMPPLSPLPLELPSPTHLPIGRLSRFLSQGAQIHEYERQAEEIKHHHPIAQTTGTSSFGRVISRKRKADSEFTYDSEDIESNVDGESTISTDTSFISETDSEWLQHHQASPSLADQYPPYTQGINDAQLKHKRRRKGDKKSSAHEKYRHVKSAMKLKTGGENQESVIVDIIPIYYPRLNDKPYKVRLIQVTNIQEQTIQALIHAADLGGVVERKSNISRLFGKFESPSEKLLMNVIGSHNHQIGQESNILTEKGVRRFLTVNKMRGQEHYKQWILKVLLPKVHELNKQIFDPVAVQKRAKAEGASKSNQQIHSNDINNSSVAATPTDISVYSSSPADSLAPISENPSITPMTDLNL